MSEPKSYPCSTLIEIMRIPEDRLSVFLAELPHALKHIRPVIELQEATYKAAGVEYTDDDLLKVIRRGSWVDDDLDTVDVRVDFPEIGSVEFHEDLKTGESSASVKIDGAA